MPWHDYILFLCYTARRISFVDGVLVGIPSTHWLMGEDGRMPKGTLYTIYTVDNTFIIILRRF